MCLKQRKKICSVLGNELVAVRIGSENFHRENFGSIFASFGSTNRD